ncbi:MAG TPA: hypothetical protein VF498_11845 [Anaerolineales bacterium]
MVYLGDDAKDEEAFAVVRARGGAAVRVGAAKGPTLANYRLEGPADARRWLQRLGDSLPGES